MSTPYVDVAGILLLMNEGRLSLLYVDYEFTLLSLFQKCVVLIKLDIHIFIIRDSFC